VLLEGTPAYPSRVIYGGAVADRWIDVASVDRRVPEHELAEEHPQNTRAEAPVKQFRFADEEVDAHAGPDVLNTPCSIRHRIGLNVADAPEV
jgi:hypothetical protein